MTALLILCALWLLVELARTWGQGLFDHRDDDLPDDLCTLEQERRRREALSRAVHPARGAHR